MTSSMVASGSMAAATATANGEPTAAAARGSPAWISPSGASQPGVRGRCWVAIRISRGSDARWRA